MSSYIHSKTCMWRLRPWQSRPLWGRLASLPSPDSFPQFKHVDLTAYWTCPSECLTGISNVARSKRSSWSSSLPHQHTTPEIQRKCLVQMRKILATTSVKGNFTPPVILSRNPRATPNSLYPIPYIESRSRWSVSDPPPCHHPGLTPSRSEQPSPTQNPTSPFALPQTPAAPRDSVRTEMRSSHFTHKFSKGFLNHMHKSQNPQYDQQGPRLSFCRHSLPHFPFCSYTLLLLSRSAMLASGLFLEHSKQALPGSSSP
jgi:hypothetical protein